MKERLDPKGFYIVEAKAPESELESLQRFPGYISEVAHFNPGAPDYRLSVLNMQLECFGGNTPLSVLNQVVLQDKGNLYLLKHKKHKDEVRVAEDGHKVRHETILGYAILVRKTLDHAAITKELKRYEKRYTLSYVTDQNSALMKWYNDDPIELRENEVDFHELAIARSEQGKGYGTILSRLSMQKYESEYGKQNYVAVARYNNPSVLILMGSQMVGESLQKMGSENAWFDYGSQEPNMVFRNAIAPLKGIPDDFDPYGKPEGDRVWVPGDPPPTGKYFVLTVRAGDKSDLEKYYRQTLGMLYNGVMAVGREPKPKSESYKGDYVLAHVANKNEMMDSVAHTLVQYNADDSYYFLFTNEFTMKNESPATT